MRWLIATALLLVGVLVIAGAFLMTSPRVDAAPGQQVEVSLQCGLKNARVKFQGETYAFVTDDESGNPPWFNLGDRGTFTIARRGDELVAHGPWFTTHRLVPSDEGPSCM